MPWTGTCGSSRAWTERPLSLVNPAGSGRVTFGSISDLGGSDGLQIRRTREALAYFDSVDRPALDAMEHGHSSNDLPALVEARRIAADRVRAAYTRDMRDVETPENIELMSVESIRRLARNTLMGRMMSWLP